MTEPVNRAGATTRDQPATPVGARASGRGAVAVGGLAGLVGIACCVTPAALALLGLSSASFAVALGNILYNQFGVYFKLGGMGFGVAGVVALLRKRHACTMHGVRREWRLLVAVALTTVVVYLTLYWLTTWLARLAAPVNRA